MSCASPRLPDAGLLEAGLAAVPQWGAPGQQGRVEPLASGGLNHNLLVTTAAGQFVLRLSPSSDHAALLGVDRTREAALQSAASRAALAPECVATDTQGRWQVRRFVPGRAWTAADIDSPRQVARLMDWLRSLHATSAPDMPRFDPLLRARIWCEALAAADAAATTRLATIEESMRQIDPDRRRASIVHSDLHAGNVIDGAALQVIDWEYAQVADPLADLGALLAMHPQLEPHAPALLEAAGLARRASLDELGAWLRIYRGLNSLWQALAWES